MEKMFTPLPLRRITLPHRIVRAATFENMADGDGRASERHAALYGALAAGGAGTIVTGFVRVSPEGRAMQPFQAGLADEADVGAWRGVIARAKAAAPGTKLFAQIAHTGRQSHPAATGAPLVGASSRRCTYFLAPVRELATAEVAARVEAFVAAAERAERAGFDGVQVHAAHGYLIHQFLSPWTNRRGDRYGKDRLLFLEEIMSGIRARTRFAILLKWSAGEDRRPGLTLARTLAWMDRIDAMEADAIEVSFGTMETAFNIIRGDHPIDTVMRVNPLFTRLGRLGGALFRRAVYPFYRRAFLPYRDLYNLDNAIAMKRAARTPILVTGGIRNKAQIRMILGRHGLDGVTLCRPFVRDAAFANTLRDRPEHASDCTNCNLCTVMSDSRHALRCYRGGGA